MKNISHLSEILITAEQSTVGFLLLLNVIVFAIVLRNKQKQNVSYILLKTILITLFVLYLQWFFFTLKISYLFLPLFFLSVSPLLFIGPLTYLYISSLTSENFRFSKFEFIHLILPLIFLCVSFLFNTITNYYFFQKNENQYIFWSETVLFVNYVGVVYILPFQTLFYGYKSFSKHYSYKQKLKYFFSTTELVKMRWVSLFIANFLIYLLVIIVCNNHYMYVRFIPEFFYEIVEFGLTVLFFTIIALYASKQENYYEKAIEIGINTGYNYCNSKDRNEDSISTNQDAQLSGNEISQSLRDDIVKKLTYYIETEQVYLKTTLTLHELACLLKTNRSYLSKIINEEYKVNFHLFINTFRVEDVKKCLADKMYDKYNLDGIAEKCGFVSSSALCKVFKKITGVTPSQYKNSVRKV
jgi:AraC-like DNA-binding protein